MKNKYRGIIEMSCIRGDDQCKDNPAMDVVPRCLNCSLSKILILDFEGKVLCSGKAKKENKSQ